MKKAGNDSILAQIGTTFHPDNWLAAVLALIFGGIIPVITFVVKHYDVKTDESLLGQVMVYIVAGGVCFSSITVFKWASVAFRTTKIVKIDGVETEVETLIGPIKAFATVRLIEGTMIFTSIFWLSCLALGILILVNGVAVACNLILDWHSKKPVKPATVTARVPQKKATKRKVATA